MYKAFRSIGLKAFLLGKSKIVAMSWSKDIYSM